MEINTEQRKDIEQNKDVAAASWTLVLAPLILYFRKDSEFIQFHAKQATILFLIAVLIALLPWDLDKLNVITVLVAVAGFINANNGLFWRVPIISDWADKGLDPMKIVNWIKKISLKIFDVLRRVFVAGSKKVTRKKPENKEEVHSKVNNLNTQVVFLESELIKEKYLQGKKISEANPEIRKLENLFIENKFVSDEQEKYFFFEKDEQKAFLGNISENGAVLFVNFKLEQIEADIVLGAWGGFAVNFDQDFEKQITKIKNLLS